MPHFHLVGHHYNVALFARKVMPSRHTFKKTHLNLTLISACFIVLCLSSPLWAEDVIEVVINGDQNNLPETTGDAAELLKKDGVAFYSAGGISRLPVLRGMNDDRIKLIIDGAETTSACANHMNPALSYIDASRVQTTDVIAGITPVSVGGDSIAGSIIINSENPVYATSADELLTAGYLSLFYKTNNHNRGEAVNARIASDSLSVEYSGSRDQAESYEDAHGDKVLDTLYRTESHNLTLGVRGENQELIVKITHHEVPYQGFPNQYMDMVGNISNGINVNYLRDFNWGQLDTRITWQDVSHEMGFFTKEKSGTMPMLTEGKDTGYQIKASLPISEKNTVLIGHEYHNFTLDDWWPAIEGSMMMGPNDFVNIQDGEKSRFALWSEWESQINAKWMTQTGIRYEHVITDAGNVQPYNDMSSMMMPNLDATAAIAFNSRGHQQIDDNLDLTLLAQYQANSNQNIEFGYSRKTRSPNLYERYSWGQNTMAMTMIGWFGDASGYVGDIDLTPEIAHTLSATFNWQSKAEDEWKISTTPYYSYVDNYIDVKQIGTFNPLMVMSVTRPKLQFINSDADFYGFDIKAEHKLWNNNSWGKGKIKGLMVYTRGQRHDKNENLYQIMPLNFSATLEQSINNWTNTIEIQWVDKKDHVDSTHSENTTDSYTLVNLGSRVTWKKFTISLDARNILNQYYDLPLGGVSLAQWYGEGMNGPLNSLPGQGRSIDIGVRFLF